jgi:Tfp pilus assembly protein PilF
MMPLLLIAGLTIVAVLIGSYGVYGLFSIRSASRAELHYNNGVSYLEANDYSNAVNEFKAAIKQKRNYWDAHYGLGLAYVEQQQYHAGVEILKSIVKKKPDDSNAYYNLGRAYIGVGNLEAAQQALEAALKIDPDVKEIHFNLARVFQKKGEREQAKQHFSYALKLDENYTKPKKYLAPLTEIPVEAVNHDAIRKALENFDQNDTEFMITL